MDFYYQKRIRDRGKQGIIGTLIIAAVFGAIDIYLLTQPLQIGHIVGTWFAGLLFLVVSLMTLWSLLMLRSQEKWEIIISDTMFQWTAPKHSEEISFALPLNNVSCVNCLHSADGLTHIRYQLVDTDENTYLLKPALSGVDIEEILACLRQLNISVNTHQA